MAQRETSGHRERNGMPDARSGTLGNIRVLDLSRVLAGPMCGQLLADLGADVVKVERPKKGDDSRAWGPPWLTDAAGEPTGESAFYTACNRGKRSITVDLAKPEGRELVAKLAAASDVLLENYKVGTLERYGLGYAKLAETNPGLIYCSITGFGQTGPYRERPGYDTIMQAMGGLMSVTGLQDGAPGAQPVRVGVALTDFMTGLYATVAVQSALLHRAATGRGQYIDLALLDVQVAALNAVGMNYLLSGKVPQRQGNRLPTVYPSDAFRCADGYLMLIVGNDEQFRRLCDVIGIPALPQDARFLTNAVRVQNADALAQFISTALAPRRVQEWLPLLEAAKVACAPINDIGQVFADPQIVARGMRLDLPHPLSGTIASIANPIRFSETPVEYDRGPPLLGEHTDDVLSDVLGMQAEEIAALKKRGALG
jgi:crotonobetainyl-CoA:carnitine CoA-transferase CaiB-like acyl-CoA transferase